MHCRLFFFFCEKDFKNVLLNIHPVLSVAVLGFVILAL